MIDVIAVTTAREARRAELDAVTIKTIAAIVTQRARAPRVTARAIQARLAALSKLERQGVTILPARFGTVAATPEELRERLAPRAAALAAALAHVRGRRQMTIHVAGRRPAPDRRSGAAYLASRARAVRLPEADPARRAVRDFIVDERVESSTRGRRLGAVHHLVEARDIDAYVDALAALPAPMRRRFSVTGPMPPFAFVPDAEEAFA